MALKYHLAYWLTRPLINRSMVQSIEIMARPEGRIEQVETIDLPEFQTGVRPLADFLQQQGFDPPVWILSHTLTSGQPLRCGFWRRPSDGLFAVTYFAPGQWAHEFVTRFQSGATLTTSNSKLSGSLPRLPDRHLQISLTQDDSLLLRQHQQAAFLLTTRGESINPAPIEAWPPFLEELLRSEAAYIQSLPKWKTQGARWFWLDRPKRYNQLLQ